MANAIDASFSLQQKIDRLRTLIIDDRELQEISDHFHAALVPDEEFVSSSVRATNPRLLEALQGILRSLVPGEGGEMKHQFLLHLEQEGLWHGYARCKSGHAIYVFFETLGLGFCSFSATLNSPEVTSSRFRLAKVRTGLLWHTAPPGSA